MKFGIGEYSVINIERVEIQKNINLICQNISNNLLFLSRVLSNVKTLTYIN